MTTRGIDIRQSTERLLFRVSLKDSDGAKVTTGTTELRVYRVEDDGTLDVYDWTTNDFVATGSGTPDDETTMTHQQRRDSTGADLDTGIWTAVLSTLTSWDENQVYLIQITNANACPESQEREFQFGGIVGAVGTSGGVASADQVETLTGGSGPNAVTITAEDADGNPLAGVAISVELSGVEINTVTTDENGEAVFSLAAGTWEVRGYKSGYQHTPEDVSVSGETSATITLTAVASVPSVTPDKSAVTITCYGTTTNTGDGTATEAGVTLQVQQTGPPSGDENHAFDGSVYEYTSDADGVVSLTLWRNAPYRWRRGTSTRHSPWYAFTPDAAAYDLTSRVGSDV